MHLRTTEHGLDIVSDVRAKYFIYVVKNHKNIEDGVIGMQLNIVENR